MLLQYCLWVSPGRGFANNISKEGRMVSRIWNDKWFLFSKGILDARKQKASIENRAILMVIVEQWHWDYLLLGDIKKTDTLKTYMDFRCNECHKLLCVHHSPGSPSRSWLSSILAGLVHSSSHPEVLSITPLWSTNRFGLKQGKYSCVDQEQSLMHCVREPPVRTLHTRGSRTLDDLTTCD